GVDGGALGLPGGREQRQAEPVQDVGHLHAEHVDVVVADTDVVLVEDVVDVDQAHLAGVVLDLVRGRESGRADHQQAGRGGGDNCTLLEHLIPFLSTRVMFCCGREFTATVPEATSTSAFTHGKMRLCGLTRSSGDLGHFPWRCRYRMLLKQRKRETGSVAQSER